MPQFAANTSFLFTEVDFPERFDGPRAPDSARSNFNSRTWPHKDELSERARRAGVEVVLFNLPAGDWEKGERGIACIPSRVSEFRDGVGRAIEYAALGCTRVNCLSGSRRAARWLRETFISNLRYAAGGWQARHHAADRAGQHALRARLLPAQQRAGACAHGRGAPAT